jgi:hypothetical protein
VPGFVGFLSGEIWKRITIESDTLSDQVGQRGSFRIVLVRMTQRDGWASRQIDS